MSNLTTNRRDWLKQSTLAALGLGLTFPGFARDPEGLPKFSGSEKGLINLGSNESPYGISPKAKQAILDTLPLANRYSFNIPNLQASRSGIAKYYGVSPENILLTAGSGEVLAAASHYFYKANGNMVTAEPTFFVLPNAIKALGMNLKAVPVGRDHGVDLPGMLSAIDEQTQLVYLVNPNNPTGTFLKPADVRQFCQEASKKTAILLDEAYIDFLDSPDNESMIGLAVGNPNVLVTRTFSKIHGMAGLRMGFVISHASRIKQLESTYFTESQIAICNLTLAAALASLTDEDHRLQTKTKNAAARDYTINALASMNITSIPSHTNFILFPLGNYQGNFAQFMLQKNIILRSNEYLGQKWCRVSVGTMDEMQQFIKVMKQEWKAS